MEIKVCIDCKKAKPTTEFYKDKRNNDGYGSYCKPCNAQKWLKDRNGRKLEWEDIAHYQKIIVALSETDRIMKEIDGIKI